MKNFLLITVFLVSFIAKSQPYHKFLENDIWYAQVGDQASAGWFYYWYYKGDDTLINSVNYTIIKTSADTSYRFYVREDTVNKRVYIIEESSFNPEELLYDFSLTPGSPFSYQGGPYILDSIVPTPTLLGNRNQFFYHRVWNPGIIQRNIEGIGSTDDPMHFDFLPTDPVFDLICSYAGGLQYYYRPGDTTACDSNIVIYTQVPCSVTIVSYPLAGGGDSLVAVVTDNSFCGPLYFLWSNGNTTQSIIVVTNGAYTVTVYNNGTPGCCGTYSDTITVTSVDVGETIEEPSSIILYPNPASDNFTVNMSGELRIYDVMGRVVKVERLNRKQQTVNCKLNAGIYFVSVVDQKKSFCQKIIIE
jgi:hypothetical protein